MKKGDQVEGMVQGIAFPNKSYIKVEDQKVIIKGGLPGQVVRGTINKKRHGQCEARLEEVVERSPMEDATPECEMFGLCGGCTYQTLSYDHQLNLKATMVKDILDGVCKDYTFEGILGSPVQWEYRNKMEFSFGDATKDGPLELGLHRKGSFYDVLTTDSCLLVHEDYRKVLSLVLTFFRELNVDFYHKMTHQGYARHLLVRRAAKTGEMTVNIVTTTQEVDKNGNAVDIKPLVEMLLALPLSGRIVGITHIYNDALADVVQSDRTEILYGQDWFYEELLGLKFKISTFSFFQTNSLGAEVLYSKAREYVGETQDKKIFDLYSGTGTIAQILAPVASKVTGVEIVEEAVEAAKENAALNGLTNCEFWAGDVLKVIDEVAAANEQPDIIVLDPPRDGIHPKALKKIIDFGVDRLVYISCKPTSLGRDLVMLQEEGYKVEKVCCVDMFPGTVHVETCVLLSKLKSTSRIEVEVSLDELELSKAESKATYEEIKAYVLEHTGLKVSQLYVAQVKRKHGLIERINYNVGEGKARVPQVTPEKEKAIEDALRHFQMIV